MSKKDGYRRLKEAVKNGDMSPQDAILELTGWSGNHFWSHSSWSRTHTYRWLCKKAGMKP